MHKYAIMENVFRIPITIAKYEFMENVFRIPNLQNMTFVSYCPTINKIQKLTHVS